MTRASRLGLLAALVACAMSGIVLAQTRANSDKDADTQRFLALMQEWGKAPDSFPVYLKARAFERETGASYTGQILAMMASELGLYDTAVAEWPLGPGKNYSPPSPLPAGDAGIADAAEAIAHLARDRRIVIVNEAHHVGQTRAIFFDLMPRLRQLGFDWYCAETLNKDDVVRLRQQGYPVRKSGTYSREPVFGEALRSATRLGFSLCAYESGSDETQQDRETGQAENLAKLLREHPDARILVHAGYGHAREDTTVNDARPMAAELKQLTGIDPLTVDQTTLGAVAPRARENPAYRELLARLPGTARASVFIDAAGAPWSLEPAAYDVSVILPDPMPAHGRAGWLWGIPGKEAVTNFDADCQGQYPCVIEARHAGESEDAVPADIVMRESIDATAPTLALFPGKYHLSTIAPDGRRLRDTTLNVAAQPPGWAARDEAH